MLNDIVYETKKNFVILVKVLIYPSLALIDHNIS